MKILDSLNNRLPQVHILTAEDQATAEVLEGEFLLLMWEGETELPLGLWSSQVQAWMAESIRKRDFQGQAGRRLLLSGGGLRLSCCGLGERKRFVNNSDGSVLNNQARGAQEEGLASLVNHLAAGVKALQQEEDLSSLSVVLPRGSGLSVEVLVRLVTEAVLLAGYRFEEYLTERKKKLKQLRLFLPADAVAGEYSSVREASESGCRQGVRLAEGVFFSRDLINHPASHAHPEAVAAQVMALGKACKARIRSITGEALKRAGYGAIYAVGRGAEHPPWLIHMEIGPAEAPELCLVGKGICFDSGGLDIKPRQGMRLMKKDVGGASIVLGAFWVLAGLDLPLRVSVVVGLAENAIGPLSYRPGDILETKSGTSVEVEDTDAEGRLVLADAFSLALESQPDYLVDFATLTGACRVALGKEVMGLFCNHEPLAEALKKAAVLSGEHCWQLPLYSPYRQMLDSSCADIASDSSQGFGGAISAALFLQHFIGSTYWAHFDCFAWSDGKNPLYPSGGSAQGVRLLVEAARLLART